MSKQEIFEFPFSPGGRRKALNVAREKRKSLEKEWEQEAFTHGVTDLQPHIRLEDKPGIIRVFDGPIWVKKQEEI